MKNFLKLPTMIIAVALLVAGGWGGARLLSVSAAGGEHARAVSADLAEQAQAAGHDPAESPTPTPTDEAQAENEAAEPADNEAAEPAENEAVENEPVENEPAENEPAENEPAEAEPTPPPAPAPTPSASTSQTIQLVGGTVTLSCPSLGAINVNSVMPNAGFTFEVGREDGNQTVEVRFESSSHESRLKADCMSGQVQVLEFREESS